MTNATPSPGELAGALYNALSERNISVRTVLYQAGGGWRITINRSKLRLGGTPILVCRSDKTEISLQIRRWFTINPFATFSLTDTNSDQLVKTICDTVEKIYR